MNKQLRNWGWGQGTGTRFFFALLFDYIKQLPIANCKMYIINVLPPPENFQKPLLFWNKIINFAERVRSECRDVSYDTMKNKQYVVDASQEWWMKNEKYRINSAFLCVSAREKSPERA